MPNSRAGTIFSASASKRGSPCNGSEELVHSYDTHVKAIAIAITLFEPFERFFVVAQSQVNECEPEGLEVAVLSCLNQILLNLQCFILSPQLAIEMTE